MKSTQHKEQNSGEDTIVSSVLSRISKEHLTPIPRSHFLLKEGVVWCVGILSIILGALGVAAIIFTARYSEWHYYTATHDTFFTFLVDIMPYTWIMALILFAALAYESVRHTRRGYRYQLPVLILGSVGASIALGGVVYAFGAGPFVDKQIGSYIPLHRTLRDTKLSFWNQPTRGMISGVVTEISPLSDEFVLMSPTHESHVIRMVSLPKKVRDSVVVGETMRVLVPREDTIELEMEDSMATYDNEEEMEAAPTLMSADEPQNTSRAMMTKMAPVPMKMKMDSAPEAFDVSATQMGEVDNSRFKPVTRATREACLILPITIDGDNDEDDHYESFEACLKTIRRK